MASNLKLPLSSEDIKTIIPHRFPFIFVDGVTDFVEGKSATGFKNVLPEEPYFEGHFPGRPIMPGVIILEALAQMGVIFAKLTADGVAKEALAVFSGADAIKFRRQVFPGDVLQLRVELIKKRARHWQVKGVASVDGQLACEAIIKATEID